jgi:HEAT repeat protein
MRRNVNILLTILTLALPVLPSTAQDASADEKTLKQANIGTDGPALLAYLKQRTLDDAQVGKIKTLIRQLGDDDFQTREKATEELPAYGAAAVPLLNKALESSDAEVVRRAEDALGRIQARAGSGIAVAAVRLLAVRKPAGATEALLAFLPFADNETVSEAVRSALGLVGVGKDGTADPALVAALTDRKPERRAAAAAAVARAGVAEHLPAVRALLKDEDPSVRFHAGLALANLFEKEAVPVLIDTLPKMTPGQRGVVEDLLYQIAGEKAPVISPGGDEAAREAYRKAWAGWWKDNGATLNLSRALSPPDVLGYTMVVLLDEGRVLELDKDKKARWELKELQFPLDAQYLPGNRLLIAENGANRITERNLKGEVLWEKKVEMPLSAQRLSNGNTFIGTRMQLLEVDKDGKEVFSHTPPDGSQIMRAAKLRNGEYVCVTSRGQFVRLGADGKELATTPVQVSTYGGRIELLPNGRLLVPEHANNRVVEVDGEGKVQWEVAVEQPVAAVRLPTGNTLITSLKLLKAIEVDPAGKVVWEYAYTSRVTRAWRR